MIFSWYISPADYSFLKVTDKKLPRKRHIGQSQRKCETWNFGFVFPECHGQLCVPSTDVPALRTCRHRSSLQSPCPEFLMGLHRQSMIDGPYSWSQAQTSLEVQLILHDQNPHPESHHSCGLKFLLWITCWHLYQAGPRPSHKEKHFSHCQPLTLLVTLCQMNQPKDLERSSREKRAKSRLPFGWSWVLHYTVEWLVCLTRLPRCNFTIRKCEVTNIGQAFIFFWSFSDMFYFFCIIFINSYATPWVEH